MNITELRKQIAAGEHDGLLERIYVDKSLTGYNRDRYVKAIDKFSALYPEESEVEIYSAPGRSEVCGNHTDHQKGMVLATSINLDAIAIVAKSSDGIVKLVSDDYPMETIDTTNVECNKKEEGTTKALIKGVLSKIKEEGYAIGGFKAFVTSDVLVGAGMSSSAAFESLIGTIVSGLYNDCKVSSVEIAKIGQFAENVYFGKPCGLMDQMACSVGGMVYIDFKSKENPVVEAISCDFEKAGLSLCIVDTKGSHADLTPDYAAIPEEMTSVAVALGKEKLRDVSEEDFYKAIPELRKKLSGRAVLRAIHFFSEEKRVVSAAEALKAENYDEFLKTIKASGESSAKYLQNIYSPKDIDKQNVTIALGITDTLIADKGVCRVHGGGFAGTIQAFVKNEAVADYKAGIEAVFGQGSCHVLKVRPEGGIKVI